MSSKKTNLPLWKYDIVSQFKRGNGTTVAKLARDFEISRTTLILILKNRDKIISDFEAGRSSETKRKRNFDAVDEPLLKWFRYARNEKIPVSGDMLLLKAQEYARVCGCENIEKLDMNWINQWKVRKEIVQKNYMVKQNPLTNLVWMAKILSKSINRKKYYLFTLLK